MEISDAEQASRIEWSDPKIFEVFEQTRGIVRDATRQVVRNVFQEYITPTTDRILELGSGVGELLRLIPAEFLSRIIGVEQTLTFLRQLKSGTPEAQVVVGSILRLPIAPGSVDTVVSFSVFDTITDLRSACEQTQRVLKPNGIFVHFLDLQPHPEVLIDRFDSEVIPFPHVVPAVPGVRQEALDGYQLVRLVDYPALREKLNPSKSMLIDLYARNPKETYRWLDLNNDTAILCDMAREVLLSGLVFKTIPTFRDAFNMLLAESLSKNGFELLFQGDKSATTISDKSPLARQQGDFNDFHNEVGVLHRFKKPELALPENKIRATSTLSVTVARKVS